jgi:hypothetical protein
MGDRIEELPVDQILPSKEERDILNTLYDPKLAVDSRMTNTKNHSTGAIGNMEDTEDGEDMEGIEEGNDRLKMMLNKQQRGGGRGGVPSKKGMKEEMQTAVLIGILFFLCNLEKTNQLVESMVPFLKTSSISRGIFKAVVFTMVVYLVMNWSFFKITK